MFDQVGKEVEAWITGILGAVEVAFGPPGTSRRQGSGINVHLMEVVHKPPPASSRVVPPLNLTLRYLVTSWAGETLQAHGMLGKLIISALMKPRYEVEVKPLDSSLWIAFGTPPVPAFVLNAPLTLERPVPPVKLVTKPLVLEQAPILSLTGRVVGPGDVPVARARVEVPLQGLWTETDHRGNFQFPALPGGAGKHELLVTARGRQLTVSVKKNGSGKPLVIRFKNLEE